VSTIKLIDGEKLYSYTFPECSISMANPYKDQTLTLLTARYCGNGASILGSIDFEAQNVLASPANAII
jgi:hypothetical protein